MNKVNYQKEMDAIIAENTQNSIVPALLLHSCCAPCSSYVIEYLSRYFKITVFYYNPNITEQAEYFHRADEQKRLIQQMPVINKVGFLQGSYTPELYLQAVKGLEQEPEGGARCEKCFNIRLAEAGRVAKENNFDYFATTLTISPLKNPQVINNIGLAVEKTVGVKYLCSDFKKREGYKRSVALSQQYNLYRQSYCGCEFSR